MRLERGRSCPRERTTSLHVPSGILNTRDEHEAKALFRGLRGLRTGTSVTEAVRERRSRRKTRRSRMQTGFNRWNQSTRSWNALSCGSRSRSTHLAWKGRLSGSSKQIQHWIAPSHLCRKAAWVPRGSRLMMHCWLATPWMISKRRQVVSYTFH